MNITHLLITRFNVEYIEKVGSNFAISVDDWLEDRFILFFSYCYPSVVKQSEKKFFWLIYVDPRTPNKYLEKILEKDSEKIIVLVFAFKWEDINKNIKRDLSNLDTHKNGLLITSRLDNDDALSKDYIKSIQEIVKLSFREFQIDKMAFLVDLKAGFLYDSSKGLLYTVSKNSNPFISLVERNDEYIKTVFYSQHQKLQSYFNAFSYVRKPLWLQIIHDHNLLNKPFGKLKLFNYNNNIKEFGINFILKHASFKQRIGLKFKELNGKIRKKCLSFL